VTALLKIDHPHAAADFARDDARAHWHDQALWFIRTKRDRLAHGLAEWETLREKAAAIKAHTISNLASYLEQFEREATRRGAVVHWAANAAEHNQIVLELLQKHRVQKVAKSKSMLTEECHLNPFLERHGIEVVDTDLGEWIVQLRGESPSHIVLPAIHIKKEEVGQLFHEKLGTEAGATDPTYLAEAARQRLRQVFLSCQAGITGVNFAVAETGGFVVCTNEGNADLGTALPKLHIACLGIEKLIPRSRTWASSCGSWAARRRDSRSRRTVRTFTVRGQGASCTSSWSTTAGARFWEATTTAVRCRAFAAGRV
jgi:L-lactate dehydrogenase complex protein LldF